MILGEFSHIRKGGNYERTPQKQPEKKEADGGRKTQRRGKAKEDCQSKKTPTGYSPPSDDGAWRSAAAFDYYRGSGCYYK